MFQNTHMNNLLSNIRSTLCWNHQWWGQRGIMCRRIIDTKGPCTWTTKHCKVYSVQKINMTSQYLIGVLQNVWHVKLLWTSARSPPQYTLQTLHTSFIITWKLCNNLISFVIRSQIPTIITQEFPRLLALERQWKMHWALVNWLCRHR